MQQRRLGLQIGPVTMETGGRGGATLSNTGAKPPGAPLPNSAHFPWKGGPDNLSSLSSPNTLAWREGPRPGRRELGRQRNLGTGLGPRRF